MSYIGNLRTLISRSSTWQTTTGAADATAALAFIRYRLIEQRSGSQAYPRCLLSTGPINKRVIATNVVEGPAEIAARFLFAHDTEQSYEDYSEVIRASLDSITDEVIAEAFESGLLVIDSYTIEEPILDTRTSSAFWEADVIFTTPTWA